MNYFRKMWKELRFRYWYYEKRNLIRRKKGKKVMNDENRKKNDGEIDKMGERMNGMKEVRG